MLSYLIACCRVKCYFCVETFARQGSRNCCTFQSCFRPMWSLTPGSQGCYDEFVVKYVMHSGFEFCGRDWSAYNVADLMRNSHEFLSPQDLNSYDSLLKSGASFDGRKAILRMSHDFLPIRKTVAELACERLAKSSTFISRTAHGSYFWCQQGFKLCSHQTNEVLSYDFLTTNSRSRIAEEIADIIRDARKP